ncbi:MAG: hypothetical protein HY901_37615 [Deltaproteobacteria bacterium]|nr:hypothetical protein [Deltaproteobacteria bacterium]
MRVTLVALAAAAAFFPSAPSSAQEGDEEEAVEGTYSTYHADEARLGLPEGVVYEVEPAAAGPRRSSPEQELFDTFWVDLSQYGRWEQDPTYGWIWYPLESGFQPYSNGWWVNTDEGWLFESDAPYSWAVYHYGRWIYSGGAWAWVPGYEWAPAWVSLRVSGEYVGWAPLGFEGYEYRYWPQGWSYVHSPWVFVHIHHFGAHRHHRHHYVDRAVAESAFHEARPVQGGRECRFRDIPRVHSAESLRIVGAKGPRDAGASRGGAGQVAVFRPRPTYAAPSTGGGHGSSGGGAGSRDRERPHDSVAPRSSGSEHRPGSDRANPAPHQVATPSALRHEMPSAPVARPTGFRPANPGYVSSPARPAPVNVHQPGVAHPRPAVARPVHTAPASSSARPQGGSPHRQPSHESVGAPSHQRPPSSPAVHGVKGAVPQQPAAQPLPPRPGPAVHRRR